MGRPGRAFRVRKAEGIKPAADGVVQGKCQNASLEKQ